MGDYMPITMVIHIDNGMIEYQFEDIYTVREYDHKAILGLRYEA